MFNCGKKIDLEIPTEVNEELITHQPRIEYDPKVKKNLERFISCENEEKIDDIKDEIGMLLYNNRKKI